MSGHRTIDLGDSSTADYKRLQFFQALFNDQRGANPVILNDWERGFFASWCGASMQSTWFTPNRRPKVDEMWARYGSDINHPHPNDLVQATSRPAIADADPDGCQYLVKEDGGQKRCNEPATHQEARAGGRPGLRYCGCHAEHVQRTCKGIALVKFNPATPVNPVQKSLA